MASFQVGKFCRNQMEKQGYSPSIFDKLPKMVSDNFEKRKPGYRDGVIRVPIPAKHFLLQSCKLIKGDKLEGVYSYRVPGEEPRKKIFVKRAPSPANFAEAICYHKDVLAETREEAGIEEWEIITILTSEEDDDAPMDTSTLMYNHFQLSGGTCTNMTNDQFVEALKTSFLYWKDRAIIRNGKDEKV